MSTRLQQHMVALTKPGQTSIVTGEIPEPTGTSVRVRLEGCGICASNLPVWEGRPWFEYPRPAGSPGHEGWGVVDAVGPRVSDVHVGERVALISDHAYAEYDIAAREAVVRLPIELDGQPFPGEPLGCSMNIFERSDIRCGHTVAIVGAGFIGLLLVQLAAGAGAEVVVLSRRAYALEMARHMGARSTIRIEDEGHACGRAMSLTGGRGYDRVIEAVGLQSTLDLASALAAERARLVVAGYHQDGPRQVDMQQWNWRGLDVINAHERSIVRYASGVQHAVAAVLAGQLDPFPLLTHCVGLGALDAGFELTRTRPDGFMKAWLRVATA